jgi:hypothetical protein
VADFGSSGDSGKDSGSGSEFRSCPDSESDSGSSDSVTDSD